LWSDEPQKTLGIDFLIGDENYLGRGFGCEIVNLLIKEIKGQKVFKRIIADPNNDNIASIRSLEKNGFVLQKSGLYGLEI
jgi:RimJ/RimL family protein N-acetyltransferase